MDNSDKIESLKEVYADISKELTDALTHHPTDISAIKDFRNRLSQLEKDIRRIQILKDLGN